VMCAMPEGRAKTLIRELGLQPHPEGGWYGELFRSPRPVQPGDDRPPRAALTSIDFLLEKGQFSAWHRVRSDEAWHLLEGESLTLWLLPPELGTIERVELRERRRHVVPADWWQAAEPGNGFAYVGATARASISPTSPSAATTPISCAPSARRGSPGCSDRAQPFSQAARSVFSCTRSAWRVYIMWPAS
jgi:predicted cupin superfamily sugar epimerase